ncbi:MAG TPA: hypothetical protein VMX57_09495 [Planctomycetota bacterium]|nr:hypothetical protein [Planctomycetota bacterium]
MFRNVLMLSVALAAVLVAARVDGQILVKPPRQGRPEIWKNASDADTEKAEAEATRAARLRLVEAVYLLPVSSTRDVYDMMIKNAPVNKDLVAGLGDAKAVRTTYLDDGRVEVKVQTTPAEVVAILKKAYEKVDWDLAEEDSTVAAVATQTKATEKIYATGVGALPGSVGEKRIPVRRAALVKADRELALEVLKLVIREQEVGRDHVLLREFALAFSQVPKKIALGLSTARVVDETWNDDGSVTLRVELDVVKVTELVRRAQALYDVRRKWAEWGVPYLVTWTKDMIFKKEVASTGETAPPDGVLAIELKAVDDAIKITPTGGTGKGPDKR